MRSIPFVLVFLPAFAIPTGPGSANTVGCGGNSFTFVDVDPPRPKSARKGPVEVLPDSLCADLIEDRRRGIESLNLTIESRPRERQPGGIVPQR